PPRGAFFPPRSIVAKAQGCGAGDFQILGYPSVVCAVRLGRVFQEFAPPLFERRTNRPQQAEAVLREEADSSRSSGFLELEIVTGKRCPGTVLPQILIHRIMRNPSADISYRYCDR